MRNSITGLLFILLLVLSQGNVAAADTRTVYHEETIELDGPGYKSIIFEVNDQVLYPQNMSDQREYDSLVFNITEMTGMHWHLVFTYNESFQPLENFTSYYVDGQIGHSYHQYSSYNNFFKWDNLTQLAELEDGDNTSVGINYGRLYNDYNEIVNATDDLYKIQLIFYYDGTNGSLSLQITPGIKQASLLEDDRFLNFQHMIALVSLALAPLLRSRFSK